MTEPFKLKNGSLMVITEAPGGLYNASQLSKVAQLCESGAAIAKITEDQRIALFVKEDELAAIRTELESAGLGARPYQSGMHHPVACIGEMCQDYEQDALGASVALSGVLSELDADAKPVKIGINGCATCCVPCHTLDISVVGEESGYKMSIGGKNRQLPELTKYVAEGIPQNELPGLVTKVLEVYSTLKETPDETMQEVVERCGLSGFIEALSPYSQDAGDVGDPFGVGTQEPAGLSDDVELDGLADISDDSDFSSDDELELSPESDEEQFAQVDGEPASGESNESLELTDDLDMADGGEVVDEISPAGEMDSEGEISDLSPSEGAETDLDLENDIAIQDDGEFELEEDLNIEPQMSDENAEGSGIEVQEEDTLEDDLSDETLELSEDLDLKADLGEVDDEALSFNEAGSADNQESNELSEEIENEATKTTLQGGEEDLVGLSSFNEPTSEMSQDATEMQDDELDTLEDDLEEIESDAAELGGLAEDLETSEDLELDGDLENDEDSLEDSEIDELELESLDDSDDEFGGGDSNNLEDSGEQTELVGIDDDLELDGDLEEGFSAEQAYEPQEQSLDEDSVALDQDLSEESHEDDLELALDRDIEESASVGEKEDPNQNDRDLALSLVESGDSDSLYGNDSESEDVAMTSTMGALCGIETNAAGEVELAFENGALLAVDFSTLGEGEVRTLNLLGQPVELKNDGGKITIKISSFSLRLPGKVA